MSLCNHSSQLVVHLIGLGSGVATTVSFVPQVFSVIQLVSSNTIDTSSFRLSTFVIHSLGVTAWMCYGCLKMDPVVVLFNSITLVLCLVVITAYVYHTVTYRGRKIKIPAKTVPLVMLTV